MSTVFLSYSTKDHIFAELAAVKLEEEGILLWRDRGQIRAGENWRDEIETGISNSTAILVALSHNSVESPHVAFEWAYGLGKGKTIVPIRLETCKGHPRLEPIQHLDFSIPGALPWNLLVERIREIEAPAAPEDESAAAAATKQTAPLNSTLKAILSYLNQRGYQMVSYDRIRRRIDPALTDGQLDALVASNSDIVRSAMLKDQKRGLAKRNP